MEASPPWDDFEGLVLRWVFEHCWEAEVQLDRSDEPSEHLPSLSDIEIDDALSRLRDHAGGLISGHRDEAAGYFWWSALRPTANGLRVLGEWPPASESSLDATLAEVLAGAADQVDDSEEKQGLKRAAGSVGGVMGDIAKAELRRLGGGLA